MSNTERLKLMNDVKTKTIANCNFVACEKAECITNADCVIVLGNVETIQNADNIVVYGNMGRTMNVDHIYYAEQNENTQKSVKNISEKMTKIIERCVNYEGD